MYYSIGNEKLGPKSVIINRPVGLTCPKTCPFLHNGCYAEATEIRFPNARKVAHQNLKYDSLTIYDILSFAKKKDYVVRIHERGDFLYKDKLDEQYVNTWKLALIKAKRAQKLPPVWCYTHVLSNKLSSLSIFGLAIYASVHNKKDIEKAKKNGFELFAFCSKIRKRRGGATDVDKYLNTKELGRTLVCPEQRLGRTRVTCDKCKFCTVGKGNILFLEH